MFDVEMACQTHSQPPDHMNRRIPEAGSWRLTADTPRHGFDKKTLELPSGLLRLLARAASGLLTKVPTNLDSATYRSR